MKNSKFAVEIRQKKKQDSKKKKKIYIKKIKNLSEKIKTTYKNKNLSERQDISERQDMSERCLSEDIKNQKLILAGNL